MRQGLVRSGTFAAAVLAAAVGGATPAAAAEVKKFALLAPAQPTDFGWNQQGVAAARAAAAKLGVQVEIAAGLGYGDNRPVMRELIANGANLLICHASGYNTVCPEIAEATKVPVAIVANPRGAKPGLVADYTVSGHEGAYMAGWLAAKASRTGTLGLVLAGEPPPWNAQSAGFAQGAKAARPDIKLRYAVVGPAAYSDAAGANRVTASVIAAGADIVFGQGNGSTLGMIQAVETGKAVDGGKVWFIDVVGDKRSIAKNNLLTSVLWDLTPIYSQIILDLKSGEFGKKNYAIGLADGSVQLLDAGNADPALWKETAALKDKIVSGAIKVERVFAADQVRAMMTQVDAPK